MAEVARTWIEDERWSKRCAELLERFFEDEEAEVRAESAAVFRSENLLGRAELVTLAETFVNTQAFQDHPGALLFGLEKYSDSVKPYARALVSACERFTGELAEASRSISSHIWGDSRDLAKLLLRLYEEAQNTEDREHQDKCLDAWDLMLRNRVGEVHEALEQMGT